MPKDEIVNFYTTKAVKEYIPKIEDRQVKYTGMPLGKHILLVGGTGSGKSNSLMNYILRTSQEERGAFDHLMLVYKTEEPLYDLLKTNLKDKITLYKGLSKLPPADMFNDLSKKNDKQILLVLDDCVTDKSEGRKIDEYFSYGRKKGFTIIYLSQSYYEVPKFIRAQVSYVILNSIRTQRDLDMILRDTGAGALNINIETLRKMYEHCKEKESENDLPFMKICTIECEREKKFSKYFLDYLNPDDYYVAPIKGSKKAIKEEEEKEASDEEGEYIMPSFVVSDKGKKKATKAKTVPKKG